MYVTLEHSRRRINPGFHSQSSQSKILKKIPDFLQNAAKQIPVVPCERTAQKLPFEWSDYCCKMWKSICQDRWMSASKGDFILQRGYIIAQEICLF